jgi:integrase
LEPPLPRKKLVPSYRLHKARKCAVVTLDGTNFYLGPYDSPDSYEKYARLIAEWKSKKSLPVAAPGAGQEAAANKVRDLLLAWMRHAEQRYVKNGRPTSEVHSFQTALRPVRKLYGTQPITSFGPLALVACRQVLVEKGYCRKRINQHVVRIRQVFKWGVSREMVPETVWRALCSVTGLRYGEAAERPRVKKVPEHRIDTIRPFLTRPVEAMIDLQLWSACRPGEACSMRAIEINMTGEIWEYRPISHKVEHHGKERVIYLGPHAQEIIKPWLTTDLYAYLFSPRAARAWSEVQRAKNRKTPLPRQPKQKPR